LGVMSENQKLVSANYNLERQLSVTKGGKIANGMEAIALSEGWDKSKQVAAVKRLVG